MNADQIRVHLRKSAALINPLTKSLNRSLQAFAQGYRRVPAQQRLGFRDVGLSLARIVSGQWQMSEARLRFTDLDHFFSQLLDRELTGIAEIHRVVQIFGVHEPDESLEKVVDITERTRLFAFAVERQRLASQSLHDEVRNHPTIVLQHAWSIRVENARDANVDVVLTVIVGHQCFRESLTF